MFAFGDVTISFSAMEALRNEKAVVLSARGGNYGDTIHRKLEKVGNAPLRGISFTWD
jgi:hypothetical protein